MTNAEQIHEDQLAAIEGVSLELRRRIKGLAPTAKCAKMQLTRQLKANERRYDTVEANGVIA